MLLLLVGDLLDALHTLYRLPLAWLPPMLNGLQKALLRLRLLFRGAFGMDHIRRFHFVLARLLFLDRCRHGIDSSTPRSHKPPVPEAYSADNRPPRRSSWRPWSRQSSPGQHTRYWPGPDGFGWRRAPPAP